LNSTNKHLINFNNDSLSLVCKSKTKFIKFLLIYTLLKGVSG